MSTESTLQLDAIWLRSTDYQVVPMKPELAERSIELDLAIRKGIRAHPDLRRNDFYDVELESGWAYIHVRDDAKAVYILA